MHADHEHSPLLFPSRARDLDGVSPGLGGATVRLTTFSDYSLRVLMYAGASADRLITIEETSKLYGISKSHLMKVVNHLVRLGYLRGVRGRSGGFALAKPPAEINLGTLVRQTESDFALVECFTTGNQCVITGCCRLPNVLNEALNAFVDTLSRYTLADIMLTTRDFLAPPADGEMRGPATGSPGGPV